MSKTNTNSTAKKGSGVLAGLLLLVVGVGILWNNEGRAVKTQSAINEAKKNYIDVSSTKIDSKNDGKLVATKGKINLDSATAIKDTKFNVSAKAARMERKVEMYQWVESCETDEDDNKTCKYEKEWSDKLIDSSDFEKSGHDNPTSMPYDSEVYTAENVKVGEFVLPEELINSLSYNKKKDYDDLSVEYQNNVTGIKIDGNYLTNVVDDTPEIGNVRISYEYLTEENVSIMAVQTGDTFEAFTSKKGKDIYKIVKGNKTGIQILEQMTKTNKTFKWFLRFLGIFLIVSAFGTMFSFINNLANKVPVLGNIVNGATGLISGVLGIAISLVVIAIAWFRFRPLLSVALIVVVAGLLVFLKFYKKGDKPAEQKVEKKE